ncbi:DNA repair metallo-beta-lactamase [Dillenia turbinata]|uniref:DNA repair metallo-beta-lactamase n=1 Tax=Dillenia turbinata TaxID=194707 RepID=A0AAN8ZBY9_9MAGN
MPIEMPKGLPFSVDTWSSTSDKKRHHFLTHAHGDHSVGITRHFSFPIYTTSLTRSLLLQQFPQLYDSLFVYIEVGQSIVINDPDGDFSVSAYDANHCPGAVMFLFEGSFGNILHTGDCRLTPECLLNLPEKYIGKKRKEPKCRLDFVFLDCTFGRFYRQMPSKHFAIRQIISCIWKHPDAPVVYLTCDLLGQEEILVEVSKAFGSKIFVDRTKSPHCFRALTLIVPEIITDDPSSRFHLFNAFPRLHERAQAKLEEARANFQPEPLIIRPSTQWYAWESDISDVEKRSRRRFDEALRDKSGVWHVCYSIHSSRDELEWALELLAPKHVVSTTPPCRAMELAYVKKHCLSAQLASDDPLWKLLDLDTEAYTDAESQVEEFEGEARTPVSEFEEPFQTCGESHLQSPKKSLSLMERLNLSPPGKRPPVTLFGRARLCLEGSTFFHEEEKPVYVKGDNLPVHTDAKDQESTSLEGNDGVDVTPVIRGDAKVQESTHQRSDGKVEIALPSHILGTRKDQESTAQEGHDLVDITPHMHRARKDRESTSHDGDDVVDTTWVKLGTCKINSEIDEEAEKQEDKQKEVHHRSPLTIGSSKRCFNDKFRKFYRSKNVPVPEPLPSLMELLNARKRAKRILNY